LSFYFFWQAVGLGASAVSIAQSIDERAGVFLGGFVVEPDDIAVGYVLTLLGSLIFHAGIQTTRPLRLGLQEESIGARRYPIFLIVLWIAGIVGKLYGRPDTAAGAILGPITWAPAAVLCAYALSAKRDAQLPRVSWALLALGALVEFACNLGSFSKAYIMY